MCNNLENTTRKFNVTAIRNPELRRYANELASDAMNIRANLLHMSAIMAAIAASKDSGSDILAEFNDSIAEFAEQKLGIKKTQAYSMVQVGATFLDSNGKSLLPSPDKGAAWSNTQFMALLPMGGAGKKRLPASEVLKACTALVDDGIISPTMTVAEIKEVVAEHRPDKEAIDARKAKRDAKKADDEKAESSAKTKLKGTIIGTLEIVQFPDGTTQLLRDGNNDVFTAEDIAEICRTFIKCTNYQKPETANEK